MRICSFLPSATEMLYALGLGDSVAGVTHECDYPAEAKSKPVVVDTRLPPVSGGEGIDRAVSAFMARGESLYRVDLEALKKIQPDLIVTQDLCRVCAPSPGDLGSALTFLSRAPQVISLNPRTLGEVWNDIRTLGSATGRAAEAEILLVELERRVAAVEKAVAADPKRPRIVCLEWIEPPFIAGHWVPEMVARAGGTGALGRVGEPGFRSSWAEVLRAEPEAVAVMPCGYNLKQTVDEFRSYRFPEGWRELPAVRQGRVFAVDATSYFSRPGPRLATGLEILAHILHPDCAPAPPHDALARLG